MNGRAGCLNAVLLVDDDKVTNLMHERLISRSGLINTVDVVTDGFAALEFLEARHRECLAMPELILLDINMPRMSGFEFLTEYASICLQYQKPLPMIIMLSTSDLRADVERADRDPNVYRFASKPIQVEDVKDFVAQYQDFITP